MNSRCNCERGSNLYIDIYVGDLAEALKSTTQLHKRCVFVSTLVNEYRVAVSMVFWLSVPEPTLRRILRDAGFSEAPAPPPTISLVPGVEVVLGPPRKLLALYRSVKISWDSAKFLLIFEGVVRDVVEALKAVEPSFSKHGYPLSKVCHYYEANFVAQPLDIDSFVSKLREKVGIELKIGNEVLMPFSISFSNAEEPISREHFYKWLHIIINPDVNAPQKRVFVQIIKRDTDFHSILKFVEGIGSVLELLRKFFT